MKRLTILLIVAAMLLPVLAFANAEGTDNYTEVFLGFGANGQSGIEAVNGYFYPGESISTTDIVLKATYFWDCQSDVWIGIGTTIDIPFYSFSLVPKYPLLGGPMTISFDIPFRMDVGRYASFTIGPSFLGIFSYDSWGNDWYGYGAQFTGNMILYFDPHTGLSFDLGYKYMYASTNDYWDHLYASYINNGFFANLGIVFQF